ALVRGAHDHRDGSHRGRGVEDALAEDRVLTYEVPLRALKRVWLLEDRVGDTHLADVVQQGRALQLVELLRRHPVAAADAEAPARHVNGMGLERGLLGAHYADQDVARLV